MDLLESLIIASEKAANIARLCRQDRHLFQLLIQQKNEDEANPRFVEDFKTLADVLIQEMVRHDVGTKFPALKSSIKGEENNVFRNKLGETICVEIKGCAEDTADLLQVVLNGDKEAAKLLALEVHKSVCLDEVDLTVKPAEKCTLNLDDVGIWIDPIDSTAEYINGIEETSSSGISISGLKCVTVLIGAYDKATGLPAVGVVNQPFIKRKDSQWKGRCFWATPQECGLENETSKNSIISISGSENRQLVDKLRKNGFQIIEASGAGYKILTVITGLADAYILTKNSTFKWDTCGPQAILRSLGGDILVYEQAITTGNFQSVLYNDTNCNTNCNHGGIIAYRNLNVLKNIVECIKGDQ